MNTVETAVPRAASRRGDHRVSPLAALLAKELRQNAKWGILGFVGFLLAVGYLLNSYSGRFDVWGDIDKLFTLAAPAAAALLGMLQILPEQRRDLWAFLIHRPAPRATIFWGKALAGLALYFGATLAALFAFVTYVRVPGHIAGPFDWHLTLGPIGAILGGIPIFFAGMVTALRPARWWGSRTMPLVAAVPLLSAVVSVTEFWQAALVALLAGLLFGAAARGALLTSGDYGGMPRAAKGALAATLYVGIATAMLMAVGVVVEIVAIVQPTRGTTTAWPEYVLEKSGRVVRATRTRWAPATAPVTAARSLDGKAVTVQSKYLNEGAIDGVGQRQAEVTPSYASPDRYAQDFDGPELWYYLASAGRCIGFTEETKQEIGVIGPRGFVQAGQDPGRAGRFIGGRTTGANCICVPHGYYIIDTYLRRSRFVNTGETPLCVMTVGGDVAAAMDLAHPTDQAMVAMTANRFFISSMEGVHLFDVPYEASLRGSSVYNLLTMAMAEKPMRLLVHYGRPYSAGSVLTYSATGKLLQRQELPPLQQPGSSWSYAPANNVAWGALLPPGFMAFMAVGRAVTGGWEAGRPVLFEFWPDGLPWFVVGSALSGLIVSLLAWRIARRCAFSRCGKVAWAVSAFWLGIPGLLLLLSLEAWPARERCPGCGRMRVVTREHCEHCEAGFEHPRQDGTEIFDQGGYMARI